MTSIDQRHVSESKKTTDDRPDEPTLPAPTTPWYLILGEWWQAPQSSVSNGAT